MAPNARMTTIRQPIKSGRDLCPHLRFTASHAPPTPGHVALNLSEGPKT
jgi:hypothetical protein